MASLPSVIRSTPEGPLPSTPSAATVSPSVIGSVEYIRVAVRNINAEFDDPNHQRLNDQERSCAKRMLSEVGEARIEPRGLEGYLTPPV